METEIKKEQSSEVKLDRKSKILFLILGIFIVGTVAVTYWRYMVKRDYIIQAQIDCDPTTENCFIWKCDPMSLEEGEKCTGVPDNDIWYYKILNRNAKNIPNCDPKEEGCTAYQCEPDEPECAITNCDPANLKKDEECSTPEQYLLENPPEEEVECIEGDEECLAEEESAECDSESGECKEVIDESECAPDDQECASQSDSETGETSPASQDISPNDVEPAQ